MYYCRVRSSVLASLDPSSRRVSLSDILLGSGGAVGPYHHALSPPAGRNYQRSSVYTLLFEISRRRKQSFDSTKVFSHSLGQTFA